jgi:hypothetical protein
VGLISTGGVACSDVPEQFGPRNCGQFPAMAATQSLAADQKAKAVEAAKKNRNGWFSITLIRLAATA